MIALRAEIDAQTQVNDEQQIPPSTNYVELKVATQNIISAPQIFNQKRLVPSWCQSIVSGTPLIVYGIRDEYGHVKSIQQVKTDHIPDRVGQNILNKDKYLMFLSEMLSWIKSIVSEGVAAVYEFQWDSNAPGRGVTAESLQNESDGDTALHDANSFLPEWYVDEMEGYFMRKQWQSPHTSEEDISEDYDGESSSLLAEELFDRQSSRYSPGRRRKRTDKTIR
ncbi:hypothetical protein OS493_036712 [Desmophyllum pertusum]|uniref:Decapping nuclease n=1 Tax=Desmophyllum pertusum TaxID=174260 RepID=A0A9W9ZIK1_9CNID|nr:hypothetical protein OS493_036712 [Desmophyllum pertusum]